MAARLAARLDAAMDRLPPGPRRLAWFVLLWLFGVTIVTLVAYAIRTMVL